MNLSLIATIARLRVSREKRGKANFSSTCNNACFLRTSSVSNARRKERSISLCGDVISLSFTKARIAQLQEAPRSQARIGVDMEIYNPTKIGTHLQNMHFYSVFLILYFPPILRIPAPISFWIALATLGSLRASIPLVGSS